MLNIYLNKVLSISNLKSRSHQEDGRPQGTWSAARKEMQTLAKLLEERLAPFKMDRVSNWANQAQICRPHTFGAITGPLRIV